MSLIEGNGEEDVRSFRPAIRNERIVFRSFKVRIVEVDVGIAMTRGRHIDQPPPTSKEQGNAVYQNKVGQMIWSELRLKTVGRLTELCCHHAGIGDDDVARFRFREQLFG